MELLGITYISKALVEFDSSKLTELSIQAGKKNQLLGITGYLYFEKNQFFQYIEGTEEVVRNLLDTIRKDTRHQVLHFIHLPIPSKKFPSWNMRYLSKSQLYQLRLENIVMKNMEVMSKVNTFDEDQQKEIILRMIDRLSSLQSMLG